MICGLIPIEINWLVDRYMNLDFMPWSVDTMVGTPQEAAMCKEFTELTERPNNPCWFHRKLVELRKHISRPIPKKKAQRVMLAKCLPKHKSYLMKLYDKQPIVLDDLPHTEQFELMVTAFRKRFHVTWTNQEIFCHCLNIRKGGELPPKNKFPPLASSPSPTLLNPTPLFDSTSDVAAKGGKQQNNRDIII